MLILHRHNKMQSAIKQHWPLPCTIFIYWALFSALFIACTRINLGRFVYPLDDTYIHLAMAKNMALHHVWGVTQYGFTSASSAPLWTFILFLCFFAFGVHEIIPLILNLVFGTVLLPVCYLIVKRYVKNNTQVSLILIVSMLAMPLPSLTVLGMEPVLQTLIDIVFVYYASVFLAKKDSNKFIYILVLALSAFVSAIRYEGLFLVFPVCVILFFQRRIAQSITLGLASLLPVAVYGLWSVENGWLFLPNSIVLKSLNAEISPAWLASLIRICFWRIFYALPSVLFALAGLSIILAVSHFRRTKIEAECKYLIIIFLGTLFPHMLFSAIGFFFRYEAYLVFLGIVIFGICTSYILNIFNGSQKKALALGIIIIAATMTFEKIRIPLVQTAPITHNRFVEHIPTAEFIKKYYNNSVVAVNDIGIIGYYTDARMLDLYGLNNMEPYNFRKSPSGYSKDDVSDWIKATGGDIAFIQVEWLEITTRVPDTWVKVAEWEIPENLVFGDTKIGIYAINLQEKDRLVANLIDNAGSLPVELKQKILVN